MALWDTLPATIAATAAAFAKLMAIVTQPKGCIVELTACHVLRASVTAATVGSRDAGPAVVIVGGRSFRRGHNHVMARDSGATGPSTRTEACAAIVSAA